MNPRDPFDDVLGDRRGAVREDDPRPDHPLIAARWWYEQQSAGADIEGLEPPGRDYITLRATFPDGRQAMLGSMRETTSPEDFSWTRRREAAGDLVIHRRAVWPWHHWAPRPPYLS